MERKLIFKTVQLFNIAVVLHYIGAGRRNTGDWCFEDGYITFKDIIEFYQQTRFKDRVLTIITDCSYSGCWVRACMEFLDEQGVQPCGHKAREKGILLKVYASCLPSQIPTQYQFTVNSMNINENITELTGYKQLQDTQHMYGEDFSRIRCDNKSIDEQCTMYPTCTWEKLRLSDRVHLIMDKEGSSGHPAWWYVMVEDDEEMKLKFKLRGNNCNFTAYGQVLEWGYGEEPPSMVRDRMDKQYPTYSIELPHHVSMDTSSVIAADHHNYI